MSSETVDVQEKKDAAALVHWNEYEALRDHMARKLDRAIEPIDEELQRVGLAVDASVATGEATQTQVAALQTSIDALTQQVTDLRTLVQHQHAPVHGADDDQRVNGVDAAAHENRAPDNLGRGRRVQRGRGFGRAGAIPPGVGRGLHPLGARRALAFDEPPQREDDGLGNPSFLFRNLRVPMMLKNILLGNSR